MKIDLQRHGTVTVVVPQDALNEATVPVLRAALEREGLHNSVRLVLDLAQVPFLDSSGIEFLLGFCGNPPLQLSVRRETTGRSANLQPAEAVAKGATVNSAARGVPQKADSADAAAAKSARPRDAVPGGLRPRLAGLTDTVREALYLTDTLKRFSIFDSVSAAVRSYV